MEKLFSAGLVVFRKEEKRVFYLLLHYPHGHWDFPKGKIESGESSEAAALRELREETELDAEILSGFSQEFTYFFMEDGHLKQKKVVFFIGKTEKEQVTLSPEHTGYEWLPFGPAYAKLTFDNAKKLIVDVDEFVQSRM